MAPVKKKTHLVKAESASIETKSASSNAPLCEIAPNNIDIVIGHTNCTREEAIAALCECSGINVIADAVSKIHGES
jgi:hypothetical protein